MDSDRAPLAPVPPTPQAPAQITQSAEIAQNRTEPNTISVIATPAPPPAHRPLTLRQYQAITLLLTGHDDEETADEIGVRRGTVCQWRNHHPVFIAELHRQRRARHAAIADRYHRLLERSITLIEENYDYNERYPDDQAKLAVRVVASASRRLLSSNTPAPTNPDQILAQLLADNLPLAPDDSPANDLRPPPPPEPQRPHNR